MKKKIIIDVKTINDHNKVEVKEETKKDKYSKMFAKESKNFVTLTISWIESFFKVFFYALVVLGVLFGEFGKRQGKKLEGDKKKEKNKLF